MLLLRHVERQQTLLEPAGAAAGVGRVARHQHGDVALAQAELALDRLRLRLARHELAARLAGEGAVQPALLRVRVVLGAAADAARDVARRGVGRRRSRVQRRTAEGTEHRSQSYGQLSREVTGIFATEE